VGVRVTCARSSLLDGSVCCIDSCRHLGGVLVPRMSVRVPRSNQATPGALDFVVRCTRGQPEDLIRISHWKYAVFGGFGSTLRRCRPAARHRVRADQTVSGSSRGLRARGSRRNRAWSRRADHGMDCRSRMVGERGTGAVRRPADGQVRRARHRAPPRAARGPCRTRRCARTDPSGTLRRSLIS
jgi:hypothetical protein